MTQHAETKKPSPCRFIPLGFDSLFCETYMCRNRAAWSIGNPDGPANLRQRVCTECVQTALTNLPAELRDALPAVSPQELSSPRTATLRNGRPPAVEPDDPRWMQARAQIEGGSLSRRQAAALLGVDDATIRRTLARETAAKVEVETDGKAR